MRGIGGWRSIGQRDLVGYREMTEETALEFFDRYILAVLRHKLPYLLLAVIVGGGYVAREFLTVPQCRTSWAVRSSEEPVTLETALKRVGHHPVSIIKKGNGFLQVTYWTVPALCGNSILSSATAALHEHAQYEIRLRFDELEAQIAHENRKWIQAVTNPESDPQTAKDIVQAIARLKRQKADLDTKAMRAYAQVGEAVVDHNRRALWYVLSRGAAIALMAVVATAFVIDGSQRIWRRIKALNAIAQKEAGQ